MDVGSKKGQDVAIIMIVIAIIIIAALILHKTFKGTDSILQGLGLEDSPEEKAVNANLNKSVSDAKGSPWWTSKYYKTMSGSLVKAAPADALAKTIYDSVGYIYDSPEEAVGAIKQLKNKMQISFLVERFYGLYKKDLLSFLTEHYDTTSQKKFLIDIINYVSKLPASTK